jgi:hypothetical protein
MNPRALKSNEGLATYLARVGADLRNAGAHGLAEDLERARRFASGSPSEFLHQAELALTSVCDNHKGTLNSEAAMEMLAVLTQIRAAFSKVGGA